jgi:hypothetical protein
LKAFSLPTRPKGHLHLPVPLVRLGSKNFTTPSSTLFRDSRTQEAQHLPLRGAGLSGLFDRSTFPSLQRYPCRGLFFRL